MVSELNFNCGSLVVLNYIFNFFLNQKTNQKGYVKFGSDALEFYLLSMLSLQGRNVHYTLLKRNVLSLFLNVEVVSACQTIAEK